MSLTLWLASRWTPPGVLREMLGRVAVGTIHALDGLLEKHSPGALAGIRRLERPHGSGLESSRAWMASAHNARVKALVEALGKDKAVKEGREALHSVGLVLGDNARARLGVGDGPEHLEAAARVLYRALGIDFTLEKLESGSMLMRVHRCALAAGYSAEACQILSAADEGVVAGLNPKYSMRFEQRMTGGSVECLARITEAGK